MENKTKEQIYAENWYFGIEPEPRSIRAMQQFADQEVRKAIERRTPTDHEIENFCYKDNMVITRENALIVNCLRNSAKWARDFVREEKPNNLKYDWITECPECKKKYDANDIVFGHRCKPTEIPCANAKSRYIVIANYKAKGVKGTCSQLFDITANSEIEATDKVEDAFAGKFISVSALKL